MRETPINILKGLVELVDPHIALTKLIKADPVLNKVPVILYSSIITDELRHKGTAVKAAAQVSKPELHLMAKQAITLIEGTG